MTTDKAKELVAILDEMLVSFDVAIADIAKTNDYLTSVQDQYSCLFPTLIDIPTFSMQIKDKQTFIDISKLLNADVWINHISEYFTHYHFDYKGYDVIWLEDR